MLHGRDDHHISVLLGTAIEKEDASVDSAESLDYKANVLDVRINLYGGK